MLIIDEKYWEASFKNPDWYMRLGEDIKNIFTAGEHKKEKIIILKLAAKSLNDGKISLGHKGPNFDKNRAEIDTIVVHHSGFKVKDLNYLSAIGLLRLYALDYLENKGLGNQIYGRPIWSGHFLEGKQVFFAYHWVVFENGKTKRLLDDRYIGWHAGDWEVNKKSVGVVLSGDFTSKSPSKRQMEALIKLIKKNYTNIKRISGHRKFVDTLCPGETFGSKWKIKVEDALNKSNG